MSSSNPAGDRLLMVNVCWQNQSFTWPSHTRLAGVKSMPFNCQCLRWSSVAFLPKEYWRLEGN